MAISATHYVVIRTMFERGVLPQHGALLELGEANWYDPKSAHELADEIKKFVDDPVRRDALLARLAAILEKREGPYLHHLAKVYYDLFFAPSEVQAIDFGGTDIAQHLDLNEPISLNRRFDVVINHGTAEHIFNIGQMFKTMHDYTTPGGMMIHESPFTGWIDHGFYSLHPTLFFDLADYNAYVLVCMFVQDLTAKAIWQIHSRDDVHELVKSKKLPENSMLLTVLKKDDADREFVTPMQGIYFGALSRAGEAAWRDLR